MKKSKVGGDRPERAPGTDWNPEVQAANSDRFAEVGFSVRVSDELNPRAVGARCRSDHGLSYIAPDLPSESEVYLVGYQLPKTPYPDCELSLTGEGADELAARECLMFAISQSNPSMFRELAHVFLLDGKVDDRAVRRVSGVPQLTESSKTLAKAWARCYHLETDWIYDQLALGLDAHVRTQAYLPPGFLGDLESQPIFLFFPQQQWNLDPQHVLLSPQVSFQGRWDPSKESRELAYRRLLAEFRATVFQRFDAIENDYTQRGYEFTAKGKRRSVLKLTEHVNWFIDFYFRALSPKKIADKDPAQEMRYDEYGMKTPGANREKSRASSIRNEIGRVARLVALPEKRPEGPVRGF